MTKQGRWEHSTWQIGNVKDWVAAQPDVFIGSAITNVSIAAYEAGQDVVRGTWEAGRIKKIGLTKREAVRLVLAPGVPQHITAQIDALAATIAAGEIKVSIVYDGPELPLNKAARRF